LGVKWLPNAGKTPKGKGTAREEAADGLLKAAATEHETLWRSERPREDTFKREFEGCSTAQKPQELGKPKAEEGTKNQYGR